MITNAHQISPSNLNALQALLNICQSTDGASIPVYPHLLKNYRQGPPTLFYYEQEQLIGFAAFFYFYADAAEIALFVHPNHRKQGIGQTLWKAMLNNIHPLIPPLEYLIFSSPHGLKQTCFNQKAFQFDHTEYDMHCTPYTPDTAHHPAYKIQQANIDDIKALHAIDHACFNPNRPEPIERIQKLLTTPNIEIFLMFHKKQLVGQVHLIFEKNQVRLTDLAVLPHMQRQGFGHALLAYCLKYTHKHQQQKITLTVAAKNQNALHLYESTGFKIYNAVDYHKRSFSLDRF
ncbi:MAG: GNAT family N-acetyltransferase [Legionellaceae bacterium]|nr:GNAT family N-acetyltransferase [Legionellaceae bacterium]